MFCDGLGYILKCVNCGKIYKASIWLFNCDICKGLLEVSINFKKEYPNVEKYYEGIWRYHKFLPPVNEIVSLGEGNTPLIKSKQHQNLYYKFEGSNPTGSFKDRGMSFAISLAKSNNVKKIIVASTGNTAASASAYSARAGIDCYVILPKGKVAKGKLMQSILHGAKIIEIEGNFDLALKSVFERIKENKIIYPLNSFNPWRLEGQKTISLELYEKLNFIDNIIVPVGNAGNISAIWKGFKELHELGLLEKLPKMIGVQAEGAAPLANAWEKSLDKPVFVEQPETKATAIRIGRPVNWQKAMKAVKESEGFFVKVKDEEIIEAQKRLARIEGIGAELASAASYAAFLKIKEKINLNIEKTVLILTGHALKDPESILNNYL